MNIRRALALSLVLMALTGRPAWATCAGSSPTWTSTPDRASVAQCITNATAGDTINVSAGSATWTSQLVITKGVRLIGAGIGVTIITSGWSNSSDTDALIVYQPTDYAANVPFRLSGFTISGGGISGCLVLANQNATPVTKVRIDHNRFTAPKHLLFVVSGMVFGVADNNTFDVAGSPATSDAIDNFGLPPNSGLTTWQTLSFEFSDFGSARNFYYEANTFYGVDGYQGDAWDSAHGGRYVARFNTVTNNGTTAQFWPAFNFHGNQIGSTPPVNGEHGSLGAEVYNNTLTGSAGNGHLVFSDRGGKALSFGNVATGGSWAPVAVVEDSDVGASNGCDLQMTAKRGPAPNYNPQYPNETYHFNYTIGGSHVTDYGTVITKTPIPYRLTGVGGPIDYTQDACAAIAPYRDVPTINVDFWLEAAAVGGAQTTGVGVGTSRPANCTTGVGYWKTDEGTWNQSGGGGQGNLYRCTATNTWTLSYVPFVYPHPLTSSAAPTTAPSAITVVIGTSAPEFQWTHSGVDAAWFEVTESGTVVKDMGLPSPTTVGGTTYRSTLPTLAAGAHSLVLRACNLSGCTAATAIIVVKL